MSDSLHIRVGKMKNKIFKNFNDLFSLLRLQINNLYLTSADYRRYQYKLIETNVSKVSKHRIN